MRAWVCVCVFWYAHQQLSAYFVLYALRPKNLLCQKGAKAHKDFWGFNGFSLSEKRGKTFGVFHVRIAYIKFAQHKANFCSVMCLTSDIVHDYKNKSFSLGAFRL